MQKNILEYLEQTVTRSPNKIAFSNEDASLTFQQVYTEARAIGSSLYRKGFYKKPVVVFMKKHPRVLAAFLGTIYSGCYYVPLDDEMPRYRIELIFQSLGSCALICDDTTADMVAELNFHGSVFLYEKLAATEEDSDVLMMIRERQLDIDPIYIVFTSGSTGVPKGVIACHRNVIDYVENLCDVLKCNENSVFGNQTPLYFDAYLKEVIPTLKYGATTVMIPKQLFMFPLKLVEFLNTHKINTLCWVVSALTMISSFRTFEKVKPEYVHTVAFASEVFPIKQFKLWRSALPDARFINLYGPTETTGICCYYEVEREFAEYETLPVGRPFNNTGVILLDENNQIPPTGQQGEICIRGTRLTMGYYKNPQKTAEAFVQNPLNNLYPELIYRTGDLGRLNDRGELEFVGRKDYQIKHMGHRIELGEIEVIVNMHLGVRSACCVFDDVKKKIVLYYAGSIGPAELNVYIKNKLPRYMVPNMIRQLETLPLTPNGKIDRNKLKTLCEEM